MNFEHFDDSPPRDKSKALEAANLRILGHSQREIADEIGVTQPTVSRWCNCDWWTEMIREVRDDFKQSIVGKSRRELKQALESDDIWATRDARWLLERLGDDDFLPPKQRVRQEIAPGDDEGHERNPWHAIFERMTDDEMALFEVLDGVYSCLYFRRDKAHERDIEIDDFESLRQAAEQFEHGDRSLPDVKDDLTS